ncbi:hypothetical protein SCHPADRAFT_732986 [Schizopora paradoxa]|uniref:F-box domain-containing protein n=1 Tax=Schizopora paradoxa TaxID=27342 RepID=A0A0H2RK83_9AGAM|nr:hypothetical protein SCHPADRAFT_732986 [Schizopora paradoxa]
MSQNNAAEAAFRMADVVLTIAKHVSFEKSTLYRLSRINRQIYRDLLTERNRNISCHIVDTKSLFLFLISQIMDSRKILVRSLEIIGKDCFHHDPREPDAHKFLVQILKLIGRAKTLESFSYRSWDDQNTFLCIPKEVLVALAKSKASLRSLTMTVHPCNWDALYAIDFKDLNTLRLTVCSKGSPPECRTRASSIIFQLLTISDFLRTIPNLIDLELSISHSDLVATRGEDVVHLPELRSLVLSGTHATPGLLHFVAQHPLLKNLRLDFKTWNLSLEEKLMIYELLKLEYLELRAPIFNVHSLPVFQCLLGPRLKHLRITNIRFENSLLEKARPVGWRLQHLDLHFLERNSVFGNWFFSLMDSFVSLVKLSVTLESKRSEDEDESLPDYVWHGHQQEKLSKEFLMTLLSRFWNSRTLKEVRLRDEKANPLHLFELSYLRPVPPSLQYVSRGSWEGIQRFRVVHDLDPSSLKAHLVPLDVDEAAETNFDWTNRGDLLHQMDD